ncbi:FKBP-type peptidyl-prolyl cis-trans isomerase [Rhodocyclaceae bacterium SMB388]
MLRAILFSLAALVMVAVFARSCGLTPEQIESRVLLADLNAEEGATYRSANRARPGVIELPDGLQVEFRTVGEGPTPAAEDWVEVHYRGAHIDGRVFEDTFRRGDPAIVPIAKTIAGWQRALVGMPVGSYVRLVIPPQLAYGVVGGGPVGPEETLVFELELRAIVEAPKAEERDALQQRVPGLGG